MVKIRHAIPHGAQKTLEHFTYDEPATRSKRLWRYQKGQPPYGQPPYGQAAPKSATRWDRHFADPTSTMKEAEVEARLKREFEDPVNQFIGLIRYETFAFTPTHIRLLTGYITMLFHRSRARRAASHGQQHALIAPRMLSVSESVITATRLLQR